MHPIRSQSQVVLFALAISVFAAMTAGGLDYLIFIENGLWQAFLNGSVIAFVIAFPLCLVVGFRLKTMQDLQDELEYHLAHDPLTGLTSRREMRSREAEIQEGDGILMMIDVDHFKRINDNCGHDEGDRVLCRIGEILRKSVRRRDLVCRYGGEEILIFCPGAAEEEGPGLADRCRREVSNHCHVRIGGTETPVTISGGWVWKPPGVALDNAISRADRALYEAKDQGRNQMCSAKTEPEVTTPMVPDEETRWPA